MILQTMLQRLYASILRGPSLNSRPHSSRQRIDLSELRHLGGTEPTAALASLLTEGKAEFPAKVAAFEPPSFPESEWSDEQRAGRDAFRRQQSILGKLRQIAEDARDYQNDHGESALYAGFPLLSLPRADVIKSSAGSARILAPVAFIPVTLEVRRAGRPGALLARLGSGADTLVPNPALLAWIEQQTGQSAEALFPDEEGADPWRELAGILDHVRAALDLPSGSAPALGPEMVLSPLPRTEDLPKSPAFIPSAVLGLFPMSNLGLLRDTRWMIDEETTLQGPVRNFLKPEALVVSSEPEREEPGAADPATGERRDISAEILVAHADPCQAAAVQHARSSSALVIHGPPGTGKSQTIANIIGDHLARGEKVLFVCDKRTALDVVKYRLDALGLGHLCGVVHDPARDRTGLYKQLRDQLEVLAETPLPNDPEPELRRVNKRLSEVHRELAACYTALHGNGADGTPSFHERLGAWLELEAVAPRDGEEKPADFTAAEVEQHLVELEEGWRRARRAGFANNPYRGCLGVTAPSLLSRTPAEIERSVASLVAAAQEADLPLTPDLPFLNASVSLPEQAAQRRLLADALERIAARPVAAFCGRLADASSAEVQSLISERDALESLHKDIAHTPLEADLRAAIYESVPTLAVINAHIQALDAYAPVAGSWLRFFSPGRRRAAAGALAPLGLQADPSGVMRGLACYRGVRQRIQVSRFVQSCIGGEGSSGKLIEDPALLDSWQRISDALGVAQLLSAGAKDDPATEKVRQALRDLSTSESVVSLLRASATRADALEAFGHAIRGTELFDSAGLEAYWKRWRENTACAPVASAWHGAVDTLEDMARLRDTLGALPPALRAAVEDRAMQEIPSEIALAGLRRAAMEAELRQRLRDDPALLAADTARVESAFKALAELSSQKQSLVRMQIQRRWRSVQRERLLATTGTRLGGLGTSLRQRLFVRGERALKLRQMIATGSETPGGDPLWDLCPVWMTSPATVAQIFPRQPLFDVVIFDEASQCRLEEALPVLLRARRVVVAGDPKQLPPTRFFESAFVDSAEAEAETTEELFEQQQSETEDLLAAALNLDVQEAFLDVHYRSRDESLIGFSNTEFYGDRLQPIPGHPRNKAISAPIRLHRVDGIYRERANRAEAEKAVAIVADLLADSAPPSIGIACFNLPQRDLIIEALDARAEADPAFAVRLAEARQRRGRDSFEGLFVKNLENVQGDERDHMIICTTFAPDEQGKFRRNFGALSASGGGRRLNVLVTRAREAIHIVTSIPRGEYANAADLPEGQLPNGRFFLYAYLRYAEELAARFEHYQDALERSRADVEPACRVAPSGTPSPVAKAVGTRLLEQHGIGSIIHWGNDGFCVDAAVVHPQMPADVTVGVLTDFTRYRKTPDPIAWDAFRSAMLRSQGWELHRVWSPSLFRDTARALTGVATAHKQVLHAAAVSSLEEAEEDQSTPPESQ